MNIDFLSDTSAPRYAYESDDEDQLNPLLGGTVQRTARVSIEGRSYPERTAGTVIIASGEAGKAWAQGAQLGEHCASVVVDDFTIGLVFFPSWSDATVIVSETSEALPTWAMRLYADAVINFYKPTCLLLLDVYSVPLYISSEPLEVYRAPVRYLRTRGTIAPGPPFMPFLPPNLIQATCAAFASVAALPASQTEVLLLLLPSSHIPIPRGNDISSSLHTSEDMNGSFWSETMMRRVHTCLTEHSGLQAPAPWQGGAVFLKQSETKRRSDIGDGGMYM
ncbi:hypothetical protein BJV78DRAFT_1229435 [Lactifluus subvellereus]|nr:hypothetical protein BJV78DRAFT_1229435 [Lactifluus subvellereus]